MSDKLEALERQQEQSGGQVADQVVGTFSREKVYLEELSAQAGVPVHAFFDYCYIRVPGNANANHKELVQKHYPEVKNQQGEVIKKESIVMVTQSPLKKFPLAWDAFQRGEDLRPEGTMLEDCEAIPKERVAGLKAAHIRTVEELAALPDRSLQRIGMDARALQLAAQQYVTERDSTKKMQSELEETKAQIELLKTQLANAERGTDGGNQDDTPKRRKRPGNNST